MRTALQRIGAGALAYVVSYVLIGLVTATRIDRYLVAEPDKGVTILEAYQSAGSPLWQAIGWFTLNAHGVPIDVAGVRDTGNFVHEGSLWLGVVPGWVGLVPMVACLLVGAIVTARSLGPSPVPLGVGAFMVPGYLFAVLASTVAFSGAVGPVDASATLISTYPADRWLLPSLVSPLVFGSLGALLGRSSLLESTTADRSKGSSHR